MTCIPFWRRLPLFILAAVLASPVLRAQDQAPEPPVTVKPATPPLTGFRKDWLKWHEAHVALAKQGGIDLLFLGDSITQFWNDGPLTKNTGQATWEKDFAPLKGANFGIAGDRTQHVIWRLQNGVLEALAPHPPKLIVLMIGTNNPDSAEDVAAGVTAIVELLKGKLPATKVLLLGIFPRGQKPNATREKNQKVNELIAKLSDGKQVRYMDIGAKFVEPDQSIRAEVMPDFLHLSPKGYALWAEAILPAVKELLEAK